MTLTQRISRCESRMQSARCVKWMGLWCAMSKRLQNRRKAMAMVALVRHPPGIRDLPDGLRQLALRGVAATSGKQSTTNVVGMEVLI
jgi:hypothetical protein